MKKSWYSNRSWHSQNIWGDRKISVTTEARRVFWSFHGDFIYRHHIELEFNPVCGKRNIPNSTEIHWWSKVYSHKSGRVARKLCRWLLERGREYKFIGILDRIHEVPGPWEIDEHSSNYQTWERVAWSVTEIGKSRSEKKSKNGQSRSQSRQRSKVERHLFH